jgi:hypothetical protein
MIRNDVELETTQTRIAKFQKWLVDMKKTTSPREFVAMSNGFRLEIERMQADVLDYLLYPLFSPPQSSQVVSISSQ